MKIVPSLRKVSLATLIALVVLALTLAAATARSYWQPVVVGVTWRDVYAIKIDHGILQILLGQNRRLNGTAASGWGVEMLDWSADNDLEKQQQTTMFSGISGLTAARRTRVQLRTWPPFSDSGAMGSMIALPKDSNDHPVEVLVARWFFARSASAWLIVTALGVPAAALLLRHWRRTAILPGHCQQCGYDLRGSTGRCSECGKPFVSAAGWIASSGDMSTS